MILHDECIQRASNFRTVLYIIAAFITAFSNCLEIQAFQVIHHLQYLFSRNKPSVCPTTAIIRVTRSKPGQHGDCQTGRNRDLSFFDADGPTSTTIKTANNRETREGEESAAIRMTMLPS